MTRTILSLNGGSSSLKVALYEVSPQTEAIRVRGAVERIGSNPASCLDSRLAAPVRWQACEGLGNRGIRLDAAKNDAQEGIISLPEAPCTVRVMTTDEDRIIARHVRRVVSG